MVRAFALLLVGSIGLFFAGSALAEAASPWQNFADPVFVRTDTRELPDAAVMSVAQDTSGFLWIGTQGGLARYDGYHVRSFLPNPSDPHALPDGYLRTLLADADGGVWIGSSSNGLVHYDATTETFRTWRRDATGRAGPRSASVDALAKTGNDLWVGGDGGLSRFDPSTGRFTPIELPDRGAQPIVWSLLIDHAGTIWAGTQDGLFERPAGSDRFRAFALTRPTPAAPPVIYSLFEDRAGGLWAGSVSELFAIDAHRHVAPALRSSPDESGSLAPGQQWSITEMEPGVLWVGSDAALSIVDTRTGHVRRVEADTQNPGSLTGGRVLQFLHDRSGMVWLANHVGGLLAFNPFSRGLYQLPATQPVLDFDNEGVVALAALSDGSLWAGGFRGKLAHLRSRSPAPSVMHVPNRAAVESLLAGHEGSLWVGTTDGLCVLRLDATAAACPAHPSQLAGTNIYAMLADGPRVWVGGSTGLHRFDPATGTATPFPSDGSFASSQVRVLFRDRSDQLWIGTENGLNRVDSRGRITRFSFEAGVPDSLGPGGMATIIQDRRGRIWAGANGGPLDVLPADSNARFHVRRLGVIDGLPHENVDGLAEDAAGRIWASTDKGIALIDPATLHARALGLADGVSDGAYWAGAVSQAPDGTVFFGGLDGITVVAPGASSEWTYAPPLVATALRVGRRNVPVVAVNAGGAKVELPADARDISVEFSALDYSAPQALRYEYRLDGYDADWIRADATHRIATYTNLSPGEYTLEVRGTNRLGVWSSHELRLGISALPPWYATWWFRALIVAVIALAAYGADRLRTAVLRRRQSELEAIVSERTFELSEANAKLQELSLSDPLTGLRNRRFLDQHIESDIGLAQRRYDDWREDPSSEPPRDTDIVFFLIDLDNFKTINDRYGHHGGDALLMQMRERLQEVFRESDFVVRWGGDEFLTVARGSTRVDAGNLAERIRLAVSGRPFSLGNDGRIEATVSIGFATFPFIETAPGALSWFHVITLADHALYMAKQAGRNAWFGLAATASTDPRILIERLEGPAEELVEAAVLEVIVYGTTVVPRIG